MYFVTSSQMRSIEKRAIDEFLIPSVLLMENAAFQVVKHGLRLLGGKKSARIVIVCGGGNNGGDGLAAARLFHVKGMNVRIIYVGVLPKAAGDGLLNLRIAKSIGIPIETDLEAASENPIPTSARRIFRCALSARTCRLSPNMRRSRLRTQRKIRLRICRKRVFGGCLDLLGADLIIDALLGTGLNGKVRAEHAEAIAAINAANAPVLSVDIPSGVCADTGKVADCAVRADTTVTFALGKVGLIAGHGAQYAGNVVVEDISIPPAALVPPPGEHRLQALSPADAAAMLPARLLRSNKGTHGRVYVFAGCREMPGAAVLCCKAAYKTGAGLVHACVVGDVAKVVQSCAHEVITTILPNENGKLSGPEGLPEIDRKDGVGRFCKRSVIAIGPGIGRSPGTFAFARQIMTEAEAPLVIDADGLMAIADDTTVLKNIKAPCVITPHPGEMAALTRRDVRSVTDDIVTGAREFARENGVVTLLKDARTVIASPDGRTFINPTGTPALAKAGSGDVLTGIIAALAAQGLDIFDAAVLAAYLHGLAGELAAKDLSVYGVNAGDVIEYLPAACKSIR